MTKLSTLLADGEFVQLAVGSCAAVVAVRGWRERSTALTPREDVDRAVQRALALADLDFGIAIRTAWCKRLTGRPGLFEIRFNGVRFYGGRAGRQSGPDQAVIVLVFAGAEQKSGRSGADATELDTVERAIVAARARLEATNVVAIGESRSKRK